MGLPDADGDETDHVVLNDDAVFHFPAGDWYWSRYREVGTYEGEIDRVLRRAADRPYCFIDAGANFGYWSVLVSSQPYGGHEAIAIEASRENFRQLAHNARANGDRFQLLHRAVLDRSGERVGLHGAKHFGRSLHSTWHPEDESQVEWVETVTLDEVAQALPQPLEHPPILKLDVEGVEIEAMAGARGLVEEGALVIFEDHGKEPTHRTTSHVLSLDDMAVWRDEADDGPVRITSLEQVEAIKQNETKGYNFFAHHERSPWAALFG